MTRTKEERNLRRIDRERKWPRENCQPEENMVEGSPQSRVNCKSEVAQPHHTGEGERTPDKQTRGLTGCIESVAIRIHSQPCKIVEYGRIKNTKGEPFDNARLAERNVSLTVPVELRELEEAQIIHILFQDGNRKNRQRCKENIVATTKPRIEERLTRKVIIDGKPKRNKTNHKVFVEKVAHQKGDALVVPVAVHQEQTLQEAELTDRVVRAESSLHTFLAANTDTDLSSLNHGHVVGTVAHRQRDLAHLALHQLDHLPFLDGRSTCDHHRDTATCHLQKVEFYVGLQTEGERAAVHDQRIVLLGVPGVLPGGQLRLGLGLGGVIEHQTFGTGQEVAGVRDVFSGLLLVAGEHPDADTGTQ
mmetsp:Transcript_30701/g.77026  ORF Transcript_30701/g.77026 Transcript_30701/m.77026 type:complete len:361 (+) Transcript_30701:278-1360(+)